jgi:hypothetical protein
MLLEPEVTPHRGLPRVLRFEVLDLDDESFALLFVLIPQSDHLSIIPVPMGQRNRNRPTARRTHPTAHTCDFHPSKAFLFLPFSPSNSSLRSRSSVLS